MDPYPVRYAVEYPERQLDRLTSFFRFFTVIPILIVVGAIVGYSTGYSEAAEGSVNIAISGVGILFFPALLLILFRGRYPRWWFDWNLQLLRFLNRVAVYALLMDDRYPSTEDQQSVHLEFPYPNVEADLNRGLPLVKWLLAIPHYIVLFFLHIGVVISAVIAWFAILFTGRYPRSLFDYIEGVLRWHNRVAGYAFVLITDDYPPFRLKD
ncbi:MAG: DUF4389 domain-containing protein [Solirubrobacterales bacterium]